MQINQLDPTISVSPQIRPDDLSEIRDAGFTTVINNRPDGEEPGQPLSAEIEAEARRLGLAYHHIPFTGPTMTDDHARAFAQAMEASEGPVFAFCRSGARSSNVYRRSRELAGSSG